MKTSVVPLDHLAQRIAQQQSELENLRREYETRQASLADLARRKAELQTQLRLIESEIQAENRGERPPTPKPGKTAAPSPAATPAAAGKNPETLSGFVQMVLGEAKGPLTAKQLADEVVRRKFPTTSSDVRQLVKSHISKMKAKGLVQNAAGQPGVVLAKGKIATPAEAASKYGTKPPIAAKATAQSVRKKPSLRSLLTELLAGKKQPVSVTELEAGVKARGYRSKSKRFKDVIWSMLGEMDNVVNIAGSGYILKPH